MKTIGIVILNYNDSKTTIELIEQIKNYEILNKIIIVDNNSTDNSYEKLIKYKNDKIEIIKSTENKGYGAGNNIGCRYLVNLNIDYIIISNPDVIFEEQDIKTLCRALENEKNAIVSPVIDEHGILNRGWKFQNAFIEGLTNINYIGRYFKKKSLYPENHYEKIFSKVDVVSGCFFIIKSEILKKINYFDENVFLYYEESIISRKIEKEKKDILVDNNVKILHNHSVSIDKTLKKIKKFKILAKSQRYYYKNYTNTGIISMCWLYLSYIITLIISYFLCIFRK